ncbi:unnamed protein product, partial [Didymodactylos carnosus]
MSLYCTRATYGYFIHKGLDAASPNWAGVYIPDITCNRTQCCCLSDQITIITDSENIIFRSGFHGLECDSDATTTFGKLPQGFVLQLLTEYSIFSIILSEDSEQIKFVNIRNPM